MAGILAISANNLPAADDDAFCAKHWKLCSGFILRQAGKFGKKLKSPFWFDPLSPARAILPA